MSRGRSTQRLRQAGGTLILVGSVNARNTTTRRGAYSASKAAVVSLTQTIAVEWALADSGIRVLCVSPGLTSTAQATMRIESGAIDEAKLLGRVPTNRWITPEEIAAADRQPDRSATSPHSMAPTSSSMPATTPGAATSDARRPRTPSSATRSSSSPEPPGHRTSDRHRVRRAGDDRRRQRPRRRCRRRDRRRRASAPGPRTAIAVRRRCRRRRSIADDDRRGRQPLRTDRRPRLQRRDQPGLSRFLELCQETWARGAARQHVGARSTAARPPLRRWPRTGTARSS